jgi:hypothetical protein
MKALFFSLMNIKLVILYTPIFQVQYVTFFHTQHIELNFKGYFRDKDSLVLVENGRSYGNFTFGKELGNMDIFTTRVPRRII